MAELIEPSAVVLGLANQVQRQFGDYPDLDMRFYSVADFVETAQSPRFPDGWLAYISDEKNWFQLNKESINGTTNISAAPVGAAGGIRVEAYKAGRWRLNDIAISGQGFYIPKATIENSTAAPTGNGGTYWNLIYSAPSTTQYDTLVTSVSTLESNMNIVLGMIGNETGDADAFINTLREVLSFLGSMAEGTDFATLLNSKIDKTSIGTARDNGTGSESKVPSLKLFTDEYNSLVQSIGGKVGTDDARLTNQRTPVDASVTPAKVSLSGSAGNFLDTDIITVTRGTTFLTKTWADFKTEILAMPKPVESVSVSTSYTVIADKPKRLLVTLNANTDISVSTSQSKAGTLVRLKILASSYGVSIIGMQKIGVGFFVLGKDNFIDIMYESPTEITYEIYQLTE